MVNLKHMNSQYMYLKVTQLTQLYPLTAFMQA